jgi:uncharacterized protein
MKTLHSQSTLLPLGLVQRPDAADPNPLVIYHGGGCPDGFTAALAAWLFFGGRGQYLALDHGDLKSAADLPPLAGRQVYVLDFSFDESIMRVLDERCAQLVVLDHHKSALDKLGHFQCRCGVLHFDLKKSGARLAWEYFQPERELPALVRFVEDRDLWAWQVDGSAAFLAALDLEPQNFARWNTIARFSPAEIRAYIDRGRAMDEKFLHLAQGIADSAQPVVFNGVQGLMVNAPNVFHSQLGNTLSQKSGTFALLWTIHKSGLIKVGLRSQPGFDCIPMAQSMGGGGHPQASAFRMPVDLLPQLIAGRLTAPS